MRDDLEAMCDQNAEAHTGNIQYPLGHDEAHGEKEVGRRDERQDDQRQRLQKEQEVITAVILC